MRSAFPIPLLSLAIALLSFANYGTAQVPQQTVQSLSASEKVETRIGVLDSKDGVPSPETARRAYDSVDVARALDVYNYSFLGASALAMKKGFRTDRFGGGW